MVQLGVSTLIQWSQSHVFGVFISLALTLLLSASVTLAIFHFIPIIDELKSFVVGLAVLVATFLWITFYLF